MQASAQVAEVALQCLMYGLPFRHTLNTAEQPVQPAHLPPAGPAPDALLQFLTAESLAGRWRPFGNCKLTHAFEC